MFQLVVLAEGPLSLQCQNNSLRWGETIQSSYVATDKMRLLDLIELFFMLIQVTCLHV